MNLAIFRHFFPLFFSSSLPFFFLLSGCVVLISHVSYRVEVPDCVDTCSCCAPLDVAALARAILCCVLMYSLVFCCWFLLVSVWRYRSIGLRDAAHSESAPCDPFLVVTVWKTSEEIGYGRLKNNKKRKRDIGQEWNACRIWGGTR